ncbi:MAG: ribosome maturation factor RimP [Candidatus Omnitrophota bacterium]
MLRPTLFIAMDGFLKDTIRELVLSLLEQQNVELVELLIGRHQGRTLLRFLVDKPGGITIDQCARLNHEIGQILDQQDPLLEKYLLEVSSPGLDRLLVSTRDFQRCQGKTIKLALREQVEGQNTWKGRVLSVDETSVVIAPPGCGELSIPRSSIARAQLEITLEKAAN